MKRCLLCVIALLLAIMPLSACGKGGSSESDAPTAESAAATNETEPLTESELSDNLPKKNYDQKKVNILIREELGYEFAEIEERGEVVSDAVFRRNIELSERFGVELNYIKQPGSWEHKDKFTASITSSVNADDKSYDIVYSAYNYLNTLVLKGCFMNMNDIPYVDFSRPWWLSGYIENNVIDGTIYLAIGSASISSVEYMDVLYFNKELVKQYGMDYPYQDVLEGTWTFAKMSEMAKNASSDLNGDDIYDQNDLYGFLSNVNMMSAFNTAFGLPLTARDEEGYPKLSFAGERMYSAYDMLYNFLYEGSHAYLVTTGTTTTQLSDMSEMFDGGRALFMTQTLSAAEVLRSMEVDFGILPYPKYDEFQDRYYTQILENVTAACIPVTADAELSGIIAEALCAEGYKDIVPKYFNIALKTKFSRDAESEAMLEIIRDSIWCDFGYINTFILEGYGKLMAESLAAKSISIASKYESNERKYNAALEKYIEAYKNIN